MGLDSVELMMAIEDEFELRIPNADAAGLVVLGDMHAYLVGALRARGQTVDPDDVWRRMTAILVTQNGVDPARITPATNFVVDLGIN